MCRILWVALVACAPPTADTDHIEDSGTASRPGGSSTTLPTGGMSHDAHIQPIWDAKCGSTCHLGSSAQGSLSLVDGYAAIVNVPSDDVPAMALVSPGDLEASYLWHKLQGTHLDVGGSGIPMPKQLQLGTMERDIIGAWISGGAAP